MRPAKQTATVPDLTIHSPRVRSLDNYPTPTVALRPSTSTAAVDSPDMHQIKLITSYSRHTARDYEQTVIYGYLENICYSRRILLAIASRYGSLANQGFNNSERRWRTDA